MHKDPFIVLGIDRNATQSEAQNAYEKLREEYRALIHSEGNEGKKAAKKLSEIEDAYREVMEILSKSGEVKGGFSYIADYIKKGDLDKAQSALDAISDRDAEWHYFQSAVYHAKGWNYEAKSQLEMAINMDPDNEKYRDTLERMKRHEAGSGASESAQGGQQRSYETYDNYTRRSTAADCCTTLICADCCCECMGGDLIRCC